MFDYRCQVVTLIVPEIVVLGLPTPSKFFPQLIFFECQIEITNFEGERKYFGMSVSAGTVPPNFLVVGLYPSDNFYRLTNFVFGNLQLSVEKIETSSPPSFLPGTPLLIRLGVFPLVWLVGKHYFDAKLFCIS